MALWPRPGLDTPPPAPEVPVSYSVGVVAFIALLIHPDLRQSEMAGLFPSASSPHPGPAAVTDGGGVTSRPPASETEGMIP